MEVSEALMKEYKDAFDDFSKSPTQSARVKLRMRLRQVADAVDVEAHQYDEPLRSKVLGAAEAVRETGEAVLVAPLHVIVNPEIRRVEPPKKKPESGAGQGSRRAVGWYLASRIIADIARALKKL